MRLGPIEFPPSLLNTLRDGKLVIFAGAGVSKGAPSSLPDFKELADKITGKKRPEKEPIDRFLGGLARSGVKVHQRTKEMLSRPDSKANELHQDLLRLFRSPDQVRLVTTNFDLHFESAAQSIFTEPLDIYSAPALPLGRKFNGIAHVHGSLTRHDDMVLTDADFGRAYLTEGWARRFLVDVFREFAVLFIGYSHTDTVMNYLARALPEVNLDKRFALVAGDDDNMAHWGWLGIQPIVFPKESPSDYSKLYQSIQKLAAFTSRGTLDWRRILAELGSGAPPLDEESIGQIEYALREAHTTRFFTDTARDPAWPGWLDQRGHLAALFASGPLDERAQTLVSWLAEHYVRTHPDIVLGLIAKHEMQIHPYSWEYIARELNSGNDGDVTPETLSRWLTVLVATAPKQAKDYVLAALAENAVKHGALLLAVEIFALMAKPRFFIKPFSWPEEWGERPDNRFDVEIVFGSDHHNLHQAWDEYLKPHLAAIAEPLLSVTVKALWDAFHILHSWQKAHRERDRLNWGRAAIELHEPDHYLEPVDALIDVARDGLEWLAANCPEQARAWMERLIGEDAPLLRRLAIHLLGIHPDLSADEKLFCLLKRIGLHDDAAHHETYHIVQLAYPHAQEITKSMVIDAIKDYHWHAPDAQDAEEHAARIKFDWLYWLLSAAPECPLARAAYESISKDYPHWRPRDHPDLTHVISSGWVVPQSPWTVDELLAKSTAAWLTDLLNFQGNEFDGPNRRGLLANVRQACKQSFPWGMSLSNALAQERRWDSDLWSSILGAWRETDLDGKAWEEVLGVLKYLLSHEPLQYFVAEMLCSLVRDGGKPFAGERLAEANAIGWDLWEHLDRSKPEHEKYDWLSMAINRPAGVLAQFWLSGLSIELKQRNEKEGGLPEDYKRWLTAMIQDNTMAGDLGRTILASQLVFLQAIDNKWTREHLIPLFNPIQQRNTFVQVWDGFLHPKRLNPSVVEALEPAFLEALGHLTTNDLADQRDSFIKHIAAIVLFYADHPLDTWIPALFEKCSTDDRGIFAAKINELLPQMDDTACQMLWDRWLREYWKGRNQGIPLPIEHNEARWMREWVVHLKPVFPEAVALVLTGPRTRIELSSILREIIKNGLADSYPDDTAKLLIHLCNCGVPPYFCRDLQKITDHLIQAGAETGLLHELCEHLARLGCSDIDQLLGQIKKPE